jgi:ABC-type phosphate transport system auxiliary subunit
MPVTDKDLEKKRERIAKLREQVAEEEAKAASNVAEHSRDIENLQLEAEEARLEAQLAAAKEAAKTSAKSEGSGTTLAAVTEQLEAAKTAVTPPGVAVDTNADTDKSDNKNEG